jgi:hypothetical protein
MKGTRCVGRGTEDDAAQRRSPGTISPGMQFLRFAQFMVFFVMFWHV